MKYLKERLIILSVGVGVLVFAWILDRPIRQMRARSEAAAKWPAHSVTIIRSEVIRERISSRRRSESTWLWPRIVFTYEIGGLVRTNETRRPRSFVIGGNSAAVNAVNRYPAGATGKARVNPSDPGDAELENSGKEPLIKSGRWVTWGLGGIALFLISGAVVGAVRPANPR